MKIQDYLNRNIEKQGNEILSNLCNRIKHKDISKQISKFIEGLK